MRVFGLAGRRQSDTAELMPRLVAELVARGVRLSAILEMPRDFDIDKPGKDSFRHRAAGAEEVMLASSHRWALMHERREGASPPRLAELLCRITPVDLVLVAGFSEEPHARLEVHRSVDGHMPLAHEDASIIAIASDRKLDGLRVPLLDLADTAAIADFILDRCGLETAGADRPLDSAGGGSGQADLRG